MREGEEGALHPEGTGAEGWHSHSPGHSVEDPHGFGTLQFPSRGPSETATALSSSVSSQPTGKREKKNKTPTEKSHEEESEA